MKIVLIIFFYFQNMNTIKQCVRIGRIGVRQLSTSKIVKSDIDPLTTETFKNLKKNQELFQREDFVEEVFLKGGAKDVIIYRAVLLGTFIGLLLDAKNFYELAYV